MAPCHLLKPTVAHQSKSSPTPGARTCIQINSKFADCDQLVLRVISTFDVYRAALPLLMFNWALLLVLACSQVYSKPIKILSAALVSSWRQRMEGAGGSAHCAALDGNGNDNSLPACQSAATWSFQTAVNSLLPGRRHSHMWNQMSRDEWVWGVALGFFHSTPKVEIADAISCCQWWWIKHIFLYNFPVQDSLLSVTCTYFSIRLLLFFSQSFQ